MKQIFQLSLRQSLAPWRAVALLALAALPAAIVILVRMTTDADSENYDNLIGAAVFGLGIPFVAPVVALTLAVPAFANEVEDRTLYFLMLKPTPRVTILAAKLLATLAVAMPLTVASGAAAALIAGWSATWVLAIAGAIAFATVAYSTLFVWSGLLTQRALVLGFVYVLVWETTLSGLIEGVRYFSVRSYTFTLIHEADKDGLDTIANNVIEFPAAVVGLAAVTVVFFLLAARRLKTMDVN